MKLSILICTMPERREMFCVLHAKISQQIEKAETNEVEILSNDLMNITTGEKRNILLDSSIGEFVVFVDDDDNVYDYYVLEILRVIRQNPDIDCIGINGIISFNGEDSKKWFISKKYQHWCEEAQIYFRTPNHISPIRRSIAISVRFPNICHGEDSAFSTAIYPLLKNEALIEKPMYHYQARTETPHIQNGEPYRPAWR